MAKNILSNVYAAAFTADPTVAPGVAAPVGSLLPRAGTTELWQKFGAADTDWQLFTSGGGGVINELWGPRTNPHPADDEFDTNDTALTGWTQTGLGGAVSFATRPAPYAAPVTNLASFENLRDPDNTTDPTQNSWLRIQPGADAVLWKRIDSADFGGATPANLLAWTRFRFAWVNAAGVGAGSGDIGLSFFEESGGGFSFAVHATINLCNTQEGAVANVIKPLFWGRDGGAITSISEGTRQNAAATNRSDYAFYSGYLGLQKVGDNYRAWVLDDGGRLYMGEYVSAGLTGINAVAMWCRGTASAMGVPLFDIDFIRFYQGNDWIP